MEQNFKFKLLLHDWTINLKLTLAAVRWQEGERWGGWCRSGSALPPPLLNLPPPIISHTSNLDTYNWEHQQINRCQSYQGKEDWYSVKNLSNEAWHAARPVRSIAQTLWLCVCVYKSVWYSDNTFISHKRLPKERILPLVPSHHVPLNLHNTERQKVMRWVNQ